MWSLEPLLTGHWEYMAYVSIGQVSLRRYHFRLFKAEMQSPVPRDRDIYLLLLVLGLRWVGPGMCVAVKAALNMESYDLGFKPSPDTP